MFGNYYCQHCGKTHADWIRLDAIALCNKCKYWKSIRPFNYTSDTEFTDRDSYYYYNVPDWVKEDALAVNDYEKNMLDWENIGLSESTINWINESIINKEQYVRFAAMEFYIEKERSAYGFRF